MLWSVGGTEHHSERWETTDKASNDDEIPPKDLVEEVWASWRTLRDHWQSLQWWRNSSQRSCWRRLSWPVTKNAMMTKFLPKILLKKFEHHSERWETTEKACNNDEIPPKDLVEEGWASFITLRDHWQSRGPNTFLTADWNCDDHKIFFFSKLNNWSWSRPAPTFFCDDRHV